MKWLDRLLYLYLYIGFWIVLFLAIVITMAYLLNGNQ